MTTPCIVVHLEAKSDNPYVGSMRITTAKQYPLSASYRRTFSLAMNPLLAFAFGFNQAAHAQDAPTASGAPGQAQSVGNNSTQESDSWKQLDC
jgi:hypothetical protein